MSRTSPQPDPLVIAHALLGRVRTSVLGVLIGLGVGESMHLREIARRAKVAPAAAQREVILLKSLGLAISESRGVQVFYRLNWQSNTAKPLIQALSMLVEHVPTLQERLGASLRGMLTPPVLAALFGRPDDVHAVGVLVVGAVAFEDTLSTVEPVVRQFKPGATVRLLVYSEAGFKKRLAAKDATVGQAVAGVFSVLIADAQLLPEAVTA